MKCPYCEYIDGWNNETLDNVYGEHGSFWKLPILMERSDSIDKERTSLYSCPRCKKTFIDD